MNQQTPPLLEALAEDYATDKDTQYFDHIRYTHYLAGLVAGATYVNTFNGNLRAITETAGAKILPREALMQKARNYRLKQDGSK